MPSSTIWRTHPVDLDNGRSTPPRPSEDHIERLSPDYQPSPHYPNQASTHFEDLAYYDHSLRGLGLSYDLQRNHLERPRELHINGNGEAQVRNARTTNEVYYGHDSISPKTGRSRPHTRDGAPLKRPRTKPHTRSGSTIDDLANIAIATSPSLLNSSATTTITRPATSYIHKHEYAGHERPSKRVRSERLPAQEWSPRTESHPHSPDNTARVREAELLLGLRHVVDFKYSPPNPAFETFSPLAVKTLDYNARDAKTTNDIEVGEHTQANAVSPLRMREMKSPEAPAYEPLEDDFEEEPEHVPPTAQIISDHVEKLVKESTELNVVSPPQPAQKILDQIPDLAEAQLSEASATDDMHKPRRIKPEVQAEVCAKCERLQRDVQTDHLGAGIAWIKCSPCCRWFHAACVGFQGEKETHDVDKFVCTTCEPKHGATTYVRKSSRARTAIDYKELNQGVIKSSEDVHIHHFVQKIKTGEINFKPETFARLRPELLTAEYFERTDGMKQPLVIPAAWNPQFGDSPPEISTRKPNSATVDTTADVSTDVSEPETGFMLEEVIDCDQDILDMVMPRDLTVRKVAEIYGADEMLDVIDVKTQQSGPMTLKDWAEYYERPGEKPSKNVISLEVSHNSLARVLRRPRYVRDVDLQDLVWPEKENKLRPVQFYCLMSVADSYTDFHIDFGGSSVYYHILKGKKTFFFIPPEEKNLKKYEEWMMKESQDSTFLGNLTGDCCRVDLSRGDTMVIPAGWIHAVWTPEDSLVIGGNFLTRTDYAMQLRVFESEKITQIPQKFRYPLFQKVMWYTLIKYLEDDPVPSSVVDDFLKDDEYKFLRANPVWHEFDELAHTAEPGDPYYHARLYPKAEINGLPALRDYLLRTARVASDIPVQPKVTKDAAQRVRNSIPKGYEPPMDLMRMFTIWIAWKTGNVTIPDWVHDESAASPSVVDGAENVKRVDAHRTPPERMSQRKVSKPPTETPVLDEPSTMTTNQTIPIEHEADDEERPVSSTRSSGLGPKRVACSPCRKRRIKCRHKDEGEPVDTPQCLSQPRSSSNNSVDIASVLTAETVPNLDTPMHDQGVTQSDEAVDTDLAQAALATLFDQQNQQGFVANDANPMSASKKGRSKACEDCRKSKRRCVHDEYGQVDPAKAAEPAKPRGSISLKRHARSSDESWYSAKTQERTETNDDSSIDAMIDPALMSSNYDDTAGEFGSTGQMATVEPEATQAAAADMMDIEGVSTPYVTKSTLAAVHLHQYPEGVSVEPTGSTVKLEADHVDIGHIPNGSSTSPVAGVPPSADMLPPTANVLGLRTSIESNATQHTTSSGVSRHSSRQPKQVERYVPEDGRPASKPVKTDRRASSSTSGHTMTTGDGKSRRSSSNTSGTTHQIAAGQSEDKAGSRASSARPGSRGSLTAESDADPDEALARMLQAQEHGLRRRTSARV